MTTVRQANKRSVAIIYRFMPQYRAEFFIRLRDQLAQRDIILKLLYGKNGTSPRGDEVDLDWATKVVNQTIRIKGTTLYWQPVPSHVAKSDLVVLMAENRILSNHLMLAKALITRNRLAFWGHGINFQSEPDSNRQPTEKALLHPCEMVVRVHRTGQSVGRVNGIPDRSHNCRKQRH